MKGFDAATNMSQHILVSKHGVKSMIHQALKPTKMATAPRQPFEGFNAHRKELKFSANLTDDLLPLNKITLDKTIEPDNRNLLPTANLFTL